MLTRLFESLAASLAARREPVTLTAAPDRFTFSFAKREAAIDTAVRVAPNGRIVGFGEGDRGDGAGVLPLFAGSGTGIDERVMQREAFTRALRSAGAAAVEFAD